VLLLLEAVVGAPPPPELPPELTPLDCNFENKLLFHMVFQKLPKTLWKLP
jgi:hypothetical protein